MRVDEIARRRAEPTHKGRESTPKPAVGVKPQILKSVAVTGVLLDLPASAHPYRAGKSRAETEDHEQGHNSMVAVGIVQQCRPGPARVPVTSVTACLMTQGYDSGRETKRVPSADSKERDQCSLAGSGSPLVAN